MNLQRIHIFVHATQSPFGSALHHPSMPIPWRHVQIYYTLPIPAMDAPLPSHLLSVFSTPTKAPRTDPTPAPGGCSHRMTDAEEAAEVAAQVKASSLCLVLL